MNEILSLSNVLSLMGGGLIVIGLALMKNWLPKKLKNFFSKNLAEGIRNIESLRNPIRRALYRELALVLVKIAEYELPAPGTGKLKYAQVAIDICNMLPFLKGQAATIKNIIETAVNTMKRELAESKDQIEKI